MTQKVFTCTAWNNNVSLGVNDAPPPQHWFTCTVFTNCNISLGVNDAPPPPKKNIGVV